MGPEILIVGDRTHRGELVPRVQDLGYAVVPVRERELLARVAQSRPAAVIVCLGGGDTGALVQALRGSREGAAIPVLLVGRELRDFADVLELGADRFLEAPVESGELEAALVELAGPPQFAATPVQRESPARDAGDPVLDQLHRTLAGLAARLEAEAPAEGERDAIDLEAMGLDAVPDVDREHPVAGEFEFLRPQPRGRLPEPAEEAPVAPRARERTEPLPRAPRSGAVGTGMPKAATGSAGRGDPDSPTLRLPKASHEDGPRGRVQEVDAPLRRDPTSERTVPVVTAAREDVRRDRTEQRRPLAERGWPKEQERREGAGESERIVRRPPAEDTGRRVETPAQRQTGRWRVERVDERAGHGRSGMPEEAGADGEETWSRRQGRAEVERAGRRREDAAGRPEGGSEDWSEGQVRGARARRPEFAGASGQEAERTGRRTRWGEADERGAGHEAERSARLRREGERPAGEESRSEERERTDRRGRRGDEGWPEGQERGERTGRRFGEDEGWPEGQEEGRGERTGRFRGEEVWPERSGRGWPAGQEEGRGERSGRRFETEEIWPEGQEKREGGGERARRRLGGEEGWPAGQGRGERAGRRAEAEEGWPEGQGRGERAGRRFEAEGDWPEETAEAGERSGRRFGAQGSWPERQERAEGGGERGRAGRRSDADEGWSEGQVRPETRGERERTGRRWGEAEQVDDGRREGQERAVRGSRGRAGEVRREEELSEGQERAAARERERTGRRWDAEAVGREEDERERTGRRWDAEEEDGRAARTGRRWDGEAVGEEDERLAARERGGLVRRADEVRRGEKTASERARSGRRWGAEEAGAEDSEWPEGQERGEARSERPRWGAGEDWPEGQERSADAREGAGRRGRWGAAEDGRPEGQGPSSAGRRGQPEDQRAAIPVARAPIGRRDEEAGRAERAKEGTWPKEQDGAVARGRDEGGREPATDEIRPGGERGRAVGGPEVVARESGRRGQATDEIWPGGERGRAVGGREAVSRESGRRGQEDAGGREPATDEIWPGGERGRAVGGREAVSRESGRRGQEDGNDGGRDLTTDEIWSGDERAREVGGREGVAREIGRRGRWGQEDGARGRRDPKTDEVRRGDEREALSREIGRRGRWDTQVEAGGRGETTAELRTGDEAVGRSRRGEDEEVSSWPEGQEDAPAGRAEGQASVAGEPGPEVRAESEGPGDVSGRTWSEGQVERSSEVGGVGLAAVVLPGLPEGRERGERDATELLAELHRERFSGCLQVFAEPERRLWWSEGQVIGGASESASESVLGRLWARGLLGATHLALAVRWSTGDPRRDVERLAQAGLLKPQEVQEALREPVRGIVAAILARGTVAWALHPGERAAAAIELGVPLAALLAGAVREVAVEQLRAAVPDGVRPRVGLVGPEALAAELRWPELADIAGRFDGEATVGELIASAAVDEGELRAAVRVLGLLGHLAPVGERGEESLLALDRRRVRERLRLARETDYFGLLGLPREASRAEVRRAHADLSATFREGLEPGSRAALAEELAELYAALDEARDVLTDEALHSAYLGRLGEG